MVLKICRDCPLLGECGIEPVKVSRQNSTLPSYNCTKKTNTKNIMSPQRRIGDKKKATDGKWQRLSKTIRKEHPLCQVCGMRASTEVHHWLLHRHHLVFKYDKDNLISICHQCHIIERKDYNRLKKICQKVKGFTQEKVDSMILSANTYHRMEKL